MTSPLQTQLSPYLTELDRRLKRATSGDLPDPATLAKPSDKIPSDLALATRAALGSWTAQPGNRALLEAMRTMPFTDLCDAFQTIVHSETFAPVMALARTTPSPKQGVVDDIQGIVDDITSNINSVTFSINVDLTGGAGVAFGVGMAINPHDLTQYSVYVMGALAGGPEEEIEITFDIGFEASAPADLSSVKLGLQVSADPGFGISASIAFEASVSTLMDEGLMAALDFDNWSVTIGESDGEGAGFALFAEARIVIIDDAFPLVAQPAAPHRFDIQATYCGNSVDDGSKDEIYVQFIIDGKSDTVYRFPFWNNGTSHFSIHEADDDDLTDGSYPDKANPPNTYWNIYRSTYCNDYVRVKLLQKDGYLISDRTFKVADIDVGYTTAYKAQSETGIWNNVDYKLWVNRKA